MERIENRTKSHGIQRKKKRKRAKEQVVLSIISLRISDDEKERIDGIMRAINIKRYSDVLRMAMHMYQAPRSGEYGRADIYH